MAQYGTFKYGSGVKYGGKLGNTELFKINMNDPDYGHRPRHIKVTVKYSTASKFAIDSVRLHFARREHVIPTWVIPVDSLIKRTKVTIKYSTNEFWAIDSLRLKQMIRHRGPTV